ncbi:hypothetical protein [Microcystis phage vB_MweS-yong2]|nr:hypothetical protein [Microcystis phage vB_MweS-yong2]
MTSMEEQHIEADFDADDFIEIAPPKRGRLHADVTIGLVRFGKQRTPKLSIIIRKDLLARIGGPRFAVDFSARRNLIRIRDVPGFGPFHQTAPPRGEFAILRIPVPPGSPDTDQRFAAPYRLDAAQRAMTIDVAEFLLWQAKPLPPAPPQPPRNFAPAAAAAASDAARTKELIRQAAAAFPAIKTSK